MTKVRKVFSHFCLKHTFSPHYFNNNIKCLQNDELSEGYFSCVIVLHGWPLLLYSSPCCIDPSHPLMNPLDLSQPGNCNIIKEIMCLDVQLSRLEKSRVQIYIKSCSHDAPGRGNKYSKKCLRAKWCVLWGFCEGSPTSEIYRLLSPLIWTLYS